jgi:hypothetical protein
VQADAAVFNTKNTQNTKNTKEAKALRADNLQGCEPISWRVERALGALGVPW